MGQSHIFGTNSAQRLNLKQLWISNLIDFFYFAGFLADVEPKKDTKKPVKKAKSGLGSLSAMGSKKPSGASVKKKPSVKKPAQSVVASIFAAMDSGDTEKPEIKPDEQEVQAKETKSVVSSIFEKAEASVSESQDKSDSKDLNDEGQADPGDKMKITKVFDFAGEAIEYVLPSKFQFWQLFDILILFLQSYQGSRERFKRS